MRTYQLRRYELDPALADEFLVWVHEIVMPIRRQFGYQVEWMFLAQDKTEMVWLASLDGDLENFLATDQAYLNSDDRARAAAAMPKALIKAHLSFVENIEK